MIIRQIVMAGILLSINIGCRGGGEAREEVKAKLPSKSVAKTSSTAMHSSDASAHAPDTVPPVPILDSTTASIRFERQKDGGYRFFLQPKDKNARMESRCIEWTMDSLPGSKVITSEAENENICNSESYNFERFSAGISWVGKDSSTIAKNHGSEYVQMLLMAKNPVLLLESLPYQGEGGALLFVEMPLGETIATLTFHSDDACENQSDVNEGCDKMVLPPPTVGEVHLKIKINVKDGLFEIREWP